MSLNIYRDYSRDRIGWFFGLSGPQLATLALASMPIWWTVQQQAWPSMAGSVVVFTSVFVVTVVTVRGRSMLGWLWASARFAQAGVFGSRHFDARAAKGRADDLAEVDLPGALQALQIHDGPPNGAAMARVAIIQNHATRTWAVTAAVIHPGIGMSDAHERNRRGAGLAALLDVASRTELIDEVILMVRTVPDDGAERSVWMARHRVAGANTLAARVNDDLQRGLSQASVRTEAFVTFVVPEARLGREARESGRGVEGRARVLYSLMAEVEAGLRGGVGMTDVRWLTSPELALACRTGFAPGDRAGIIEALAAAETDPAVNTEVPWAMAGPSGADLVARHYSHDAWNSVSATIKLPTKGAVMGALTPILTPTGPAERRSLMVAFPILKQSTAERQVDSAEFAVDMGSELRRKAGVRAKARHRNEAATAQGMDEKLARGGAMTRPYAVCCVTVPKTVRIAEYGRHLDASVRRAGFAPLRLDLAQDAGFAAASIPLGLSLTRKSGS